MINVIETVNWSTTNPFLISEALPVFNFIPFKMETGLKDDRYKEG